MLKLYFSEMFIRSFREILSDGTLQLNSIRGMQLPCKVHPCKTRAVLNCVVPYELKKFFRISEFSCKLTLLLQKLLEMPFTLFSYDFTKNEITWNLKELLQSVA